MATHLGKWLQTQINGEGLPSFAELAEHLGWRYDKLSSIMYGTKTATDGDIVDLSLRTTSSEHFLHSLRNEGKVVDANLEELAWEANGYSALLEDPPREGFNHQKQSEGTALDKEIQSFVELLEQMRGAIRSQSEKIEFQRVQLQELEAKHAAIKEQKEDIERKLRDQNYFAQRVGKEVVKAQMKAAKHGPDSVLR